MDEVEKIMAGLPVGARRACLLASSEWQFAGRETFNANGIWSLHHTKRAGGRGALVERELQPTGKHKRAAYRLTPLGLRVRAALQEAGDA